MDKRKHSDYHSVENVSQEWSLIILISKGTKVVSAWVKGGCFISLSIAVEQRLLYTFIYIYLDGSAEDKKSSRSTLEDDGKSLLLEKEGKLKSFIISSSPNARAKT